MVLWGVLFFFYIITLDHRILDDKIFSDRTEKEARFWQWWQRQGTQLFFSSPNLENSTIKWCPLLCSFFLVFLRDPLQYSCLENPMDGVAWWAAVHGVAKSRTRLSDSTFTFHFHALEKEMATHSSVLAWRIPGMGEPGGLPSMGLHRVGHDWSDLAAAAAEINTRGSILIWSHRRGIKSLLVGLIPFTVPLKAHT